jgi:hypothetical protein
VRQILKLFFILLNLLVCSSLLAEIKNRPSWIGSPADACSPAELCAVGEGTGQLQAEANARKNLALIFEVKIKSKTKASSQAQQTTRGEVITSGDASEEISTQIEESTEDVLKGVEIKQKYEDDKSAYALASLNKTKAATGFLQEIADIDEKIKLFYQDNKRSSLSKIFKLLPVRDALKQRVVILKGEAPQPPVSLKELLKKKREFGKEGVTVYLQIEEAGKIKEVEQMIIKILLDNDYRVVTKEGLKHQIVLKGELGQEKQFLNVSGFEKYKFQLTLTALDESGKKSGTAVATVEQVGRSEKHAYDQAVSQIADIIKENFDQLNMD